MHSFNSREFHADLEVKTRYYDWIRYLIKRYHFEEGTDYVVAKEETPTRGRNPTVYYFNRPCALIIAASYVSHPVAHHLYRKVLKEEAARAA